MSLQDVLTFLSCPECALADLAMVLEKTVEQLNMRQQQMRVDVQVTAIEQTADMLEEAKLKASAM